VGGIVGTALLRNYSSHKLPQISCCLILYSTASTSPDIVGTQPMDSLQSQTSADILGGNCQIEERQPELIRHG